MVPMLLALPMLAAFTAQQPPQAQVLPSSSLAGFEQRRPASVPIVAPPPRRCADNPDQDSEEIVVCGGNGEEYRIGELAPEAPPAPTFTGVSTPTSAMDASRCAVTRCAPEAKIDLIGGARKIGQALGRLLDPD